MRETRPGAAPGPSDLKKFLRYHQTEDMFGRVANNLGATVWFSMYRSTGQIGAAPELWLYSSEEDAQLQDIAAGLAWVPGRSGRPHAHDQYGRITPEQMFLQCQGPGAIWSTLGHTYTNAQDLSGSETTSDTSGTALTYETGQTTPRGPIGSSGQLAYPGYDSSAAPSTANSLASSSDSSRWPNNPAAPQEVYGQSDFLSFENPPTGSYGSQSNPAAQGYTYEQVYPPSGNPMTGSFGQPTMSAEQASFQDPRNPLAQSSRPRDVPEAYERAPRSARDQAMGFGNPSARRRQPRNPPTESLASEDDSAARSEFSSSTLSSRVEPSANSPADPYGGPRAPPPTDYVQYQDLRTPTQENPQNSEMSDRDADGDSDPEIPGARYRIQNASRDAFSDVSTVQDGYAGMQEPGRVDDSGSESQTNQSQSVGRMSRPSDIWT
jgi:hypothetical protein